MENIVFSVSPHKIMQNHYEITSKSKFWNQHVQLWYLHHPALSNSLHIRLTQRDARDIIFVLFHFVNFSLTRDAFRYL